MRDTFAVERREAYINGLMVRFDLLSDMVEDLALGELVDRAVLVNALDGERVRRKFLYLVNVDCLGMIQPSVDNGDLRTVGHRESLYVEAEQ